MQLIVSTDVRVDLPLAFMHISISVGYTVYRPK